MPSLGRIGIWSMELRFGDRAQAELAAAELDELGYGTLWIPGGIGGDITGDIDRLLGATTRATIATGILNIWMHDPAEIASWWKRLPDDRQQRVLLGLGVSHSHLVGEAYERPLAKMASYLDRLDEEGLPAEARCLAALGPKMQELARERSCGVHPYLVSPDHTRSAREVLGPGKLVAPEQGIVLDSDLASAREKARGALAGYVQYPNYRNNWLRLGFTVEEIDAMSDRLVDSLFACGDLAAITARLEEHWSAGADHVCIQAITGQGLDLGPSMEVWRSVAGTGVR
ncbi:TIGR03620 family F420-dependent LLM class oxidoreductase [Novosphingobium sp. RL4]|uniref:TIGR03620 family F420-dependent LLM class oxidoreductase n=1 Tax=Novosphingobium sp. RL4 TaxID=3109595 RepID=UPI002D76ECF5|nr:TIGR03620 family F420-dependent LLM class oxidoreductase [Novosphingobium sp. RL4]WRT95155.1 TIGR03620 family F420-dependent LLM class oxidoreductase [Novosphingobium sp. RL4]